jgi:WD40 repeat protein
VTITNEELKTRIVTAAGDKTTRVWDARNGKLLAVYHGYANPVISGRFIPGGNVLSVDDKSSARVCPADLLPSSRNRTPRTLMMDERKQEVPAPLR